MPHATVPLDPVLNTDDQKSIDAGAERRRAGVLARHDRGDNRVEHRPRPLVIAERTSTIGIADDILSPYSARQRSPCTT